MIYDYAGKWAFGNERSRSESISSVKEARLIPADGIISSQNTDVQQALKMAQRSATIVCYILSLLVVTAFILSSFILESPVRRVRLLAAGLVNQVADHNAVSTQGDFLLGVGKADITG